MTASDWQTVRLEDLAAHGRDNFVDGDWIESKDQDDNGKVRLLQVGNVLRGALKTGGSLRWVNDDTVKRLNCTLLRMGDILIARMPDPIGRACLVPELPYPAITAVDCAVLRVNVEAVEPLFAVQYFNSDQHLAAVASHITGSTRQRISRGNLAGLPVALPPLGEQRKIAAILSSVDDAIEATKAVIEQLQVVKKAMMAELLTRGLPGRHTRFKMTEIGEVPEEWEVAPLSTLAELTGGFAFKSEDYSSEGRFVLRTLNITNDGRVSREDAVFVPEERADEFKKFALKTGDIVFVMIGATLGKTGQVRSVDLPCLLNQNMWLIRAREGVNPTFMFFAFRTASGRKLNTVAGSARGFVRRDEYRDLLIALPSQNEQQSIASALGELDSRIDAEVTFVAQQRTVKAALMSVLLTGEVRVTPDEVAA